MDKEAKTQLYEAYLSDRARTIEVQLPKGPKISFLKSWDYKSTMKSIEFKTLNMPDTKHDSVKIETVDLMPVANFQYYQIIIKR